MNTLWNLLAYFLGLAGIMVMGLVFCIIGFFVLLTFVGEKADKTTGVLA